jgi:hypothetical protein
MNYFYTLLALGAVGLVLTATFQGYSANLQAVSERRGVRKLLEPLAAEGVELIALTEATGASVRKHLHLPRTVGGRFWWARLVSDSTGTWIEGAFGPSWEGRPEWRVDLPPTATASGTYEGVYGTPTLTCSIQDTETVLTLSTWEGG